jgi:hypothetical protein
MYGESPFADTCYDPLQQLSWWQAKKDDPNASVLAVSCFLFTYHTVAIA